MWRGFVVTRSNSTNFRIGLRRWAACVGAADLQAAYGQAQKLLRSQRYEVRRIVESGDEVAVELEWTGVLAVPVAAMNLEAGHEMKAFVAMFLTIRDGKIVSQRNYDCYPPFDAAAGELMRAPVAAGAGAGERNG